MNCVYCNHFIGTWLLPVKMDSSAFGFGFQIRIPLGECLLLAVTDFTHTFFNLHVIIFIFSNSPVKFMEKNKMGDQTLCSSFSPGGKYFVTGGTDKFVRVYVCIPGPPTLMAEVLAHSVRLTTKSMAK